jgi:hypothetical protein
MITIVKLEPLTLVHGNVDTDRLSKLIVICKDMYLKPVMGKDFYNAFNALTSYTTIETELLDDYIYPFMARAVEVEAAKHFNWEVRDKSTGASSDQYQTASDWDSNKNLVNDYTKKMQHYKIELIDFLEENILSFPLYKSNCNSFENKGDSYSNNVSFISRRRG